MIIESVLLLNIADPTVKLHDPKDPFTPATKSKQHTGGSRGPSPKRLTKFFSSVK